MLATETNESVRSEGEPLSAIAAGSVSIHAREVNSAMQTVIQKNVCARVACALEIHHGKKKSTVSPPSTPCAITVASAATPNHFIRRRASDRQIQTVMTM